MFAFISKVLVVSLVSLSCTIEPTFFEVSEEAIVGGELEFNFPEIGILSSGCTGTLISDKVVLTAAHCIDERETMFFHITEFLEDENGNEEQIIIASFEANRVFAHHLFDINNLNAGHDIGALVLKKSVPAKLATPMAFLNDLFDNNFIGQEFLAVGYGQSNPEQGTGGGIKRSVSMTVDDIAAEFYEYGSSETNICFGDSGGPDIININGVNTVVGVHAIVRAPFCRAISASTRLDIHFSEFIEPILNGGVPSNGNTCVADGVCLNACGLTDPDCECRLDGFCDEACENGAAIDPDCCANNAVCNEACEQNGIIDSDCFGGACSVLPEKTAQNPNNPYGILFSLFAMILFTLFAFRRYNSL